MIDLTPQERTYLLGCIDRDPRQLASVASLRVKLERAPKTPVATFKITRLNANTSRHFLVWHDEPREAGEYPLFRAPS